jgi:hypothetical protein
MKNLLRVLLTCLVLVGGTAFFAYYQFNQFNNELDTLSASYLAIADISPISNKIRKEPIPSTIPETVSTSATSTDLKPSFVFFKNDEAYIGCTYQISFQSASTTGLLETALIDAGTTETAIPITDSLVEEDEIELNSQSIDWKVGSVSPGEYYIKASTNDGVDLESKVFTIRKMPAGLRASDREKICKESDGSF